MQQRCPPIPYDLRIGVTGHRTLVDADAVRCRVESLLDQIDATLRSATARPRGPAGSQYAWWFDKVLIRASKIIWCNLPYSLESVPADKQTSLEWSVISPLAKGADRLVAGAVLKRSQARLSVIIPFAKADYEKDFAESDDLAEFRELWTKAAATRELDSDYGAFLPTDTEAEKQRKQALRDQGYLRVGRETVDACEILIAIWNGEPAAGTGGTGDVVKYAIEQGRLVLWIDTSCTIAAVKMIIRKSPSDEGDLPLPGTTTKPLPSRARDISVSFHRLAAYNRDVAYDAKAYETAYGRNVAQLRQSADDAKLPDALLNSILSKLLPYFVRADLAAIRYQGLYVFVAVGLYSLSALAVTIAVVQVLFFPHQLWLIGFEVLAMLAAVALLRLGRSESWHDKWLHDRHFAEQLRMAMFTSLLGIDPTTGQMASSINALPFYEGPARWVGDALRRIMRDVTAGPLQPHFQSIKRFVIDGWIADQAAWHSRKAEEKHNASHKSHIAGVVLFIATLCAAYLHWAGVGHSVAEHERTIASVFGLCATALAIICPAWAAAIHAINVLREHERIAKRSRQMASLLRSIGYRAEQTPSLDELRRQIDVAQQVMATENLEWWISLSFRVPELPA